MSFAEINFSHQLAFRRAGPKQWGTAFVSLSVTDRDRGRNPAGAGPSRPQEAANASLRWHKNVNSSTGKGSLIR